MFKITVLALGLLLSFASFAESECASNMEEVRDLVGNSAFSRSWKEDSKNPLDLNIKDGKNELILELTKTKGDWATAYAVFCKDGKNYVAKVRKIVWGDAAPGLARGREIKSMKIKLPYQSEMKVSVSIATFTFNPK